MKDNKEVDMIIVLKGFTVGDTSSSLAEGLTKKQTLRKCIENGIKAAGCDFINIDLVDAIIDIPGNVEYIKPLLPRR